MSYTFAESHGAAVADDKRFLLKRGEWWHCRVRVPPSLKELLGNHIVKALHTIDKTEVRKLRWPMVTAIKAQIGAMEANPVKGLASAWRDKLKADKFDAHDFVNQTQQPVRRYGDNAGPNFQREALNYSWTSIMAKRDGLRRKHSTAKPSPDTNTASSS